MKLKTSIALIYSKWHLLNLQSLKLDSEKLIIFIHNYEDENKGPRVTQKDIERSNINPIKIQMFNLNSRFELMIKTAEIFKISENYQIITPGEINLILSLFFKLLTKTSLTVIDEGTSSYFSAGNKGLETKINRLSKFKARLKSKFQFSYNDNKLFRSSLNGSLEINLKTKQKLLNALSNIKLKNKNEFSDHKIILLDNFNEIFKSKKDKYSFLERIIGRTSNNKIIIKPHPFCTDLPPSIKAFYNETLFYMSAEEVLFNKNFKKIYSGISTAGVNAHHLFNKKVEFYLDFYLDYNISDFYKNRIHEFKKLFL